MKYFDNVFSIPDDKNYNIIGLNKELSCINIYNKFLKSEKGMLVVCSTTYVANIIYQTLLNYTENVLFFPMDDFLTSEAISISPELKVERINTLNILSNNSRYIVVTNLMGYLRYLPSKDMWLKSKIELKKGMSIDRDKLIEKLYNIGYEREILVNGTGKIGVRGYVLDIFPTSYEDAVRIEFWGDNIENIKYFDIDTQLTKSEIEKIDIYPFSEFILDKFDDNTIRKQKYLKNYSNSVCSLLNYFDEKNVVFYEKNVIDKSYELLVDTILEYKNNNIEEIDTNYMFNFNDISYDKCISFYHFDELILRNNNYKYDYSLAVNYNGDYNKIKEDLVKYIKENKTVIICVNNENGVKRICKYLELEDLNICSEENIILNKINIIIKNISDGYIYNDFIVLGKNNLYGIKEEITKYKSKYKIGTKIQSITNIDIGDYVVHELFGIGIYQGLVSMNKNGLKKDYVKILYDGGDTLYIPVENIDRISKYSGKEGNIKINSLSSDNWKKKKQKVKEKLEDIAQDIIMVSAERMTKKGFSFSEDDENQQLFDSEFEYTETTDQLKAIDVIKEAMHSNVPMDMLLCGDVGYGKTEVAFRAMFKAVNDGKQVAYLCPTTILSNQQYKLALKRFSSFPVNIALINRFVEKSKQTKIINDLKEGKIDIIFGTHRLLGNDINFKDLGLLVIDEEQRFGVIHKEKIKKYKSNIDVLTLSATPIPRTLQMSMTGIRGLALIESPPKERYPIQTYVLEESDLVIKDAIYKELSRGGQVFLLYNSVEKIQDKVIEIRKLVPEAEIDFVHGQMTKDQLENKINKFILGKFNVLICTTIIETGIDMPNVNTLIVLNADKFGLSQLYQIRGRIGRSNKIGYAYLMYDKHKFLNDVAIKRLDAIKEFTELGSGYKIAMRDLAIRGAGDMLGREQSGFIDSIGIDLYLKMLNDAIRKYKGEKVIENNDVKNDKPLINVSTHIDDNYVSDIELKILIHKKINDVDSYDSFCKIKEELEDRFGKLSEDLITYMYEEWFEKLSKMLNINKVVEDNKVISLILPSEYNEYIEGDKLFYECYNISKNFKLGYKDNSIIINLEKKDTLKNNIMYLIGLLIIIKNMVLNN